jgi:hypothetical protein
LGEWLNSVLAENLEQHDNPLDICINAQHWFSVAFNELVRQVSINCAERGRLFAVIWRRNEDLLSKLIDVQRNERQYILTCHKDRMQFLKTDLDFCLSRLATIEAAIDDDHSRWASSRERDLDKFDSLQHKIDEQIARRKELAVELRELRQKLGMPDETDAEEAVDEPSPSFDYDDLACRAQSVRWAMRGGRGDLPTLSAELDDVRHFLDGKRGDLRREFRRYFLVLPGDAQPKIRSAQWLLAAISYIYSFYMSFLASPTIDRSMVEKPFADVVYELLLGVYGSRVHAEQVFLDIL